MDIVRQLNTMNQAAQLLFSIGSSDSDTRGYEIQDSEEYQQLMDSLIEWCEDNSHCIMMNEDEFISIHFTD